ncbi:MAG TPA: RagB/SusD family nutrient uptake outer membrane protein [Gemmatimonadaceae bacterium]|nr:RagB/SusD family nutrient uptake outer membrane protein [Gemmatimonadaceae bacterium]
MRINKLLLVLSAVGLSACSNTLDVPPTSSISSEVAITDAVGARAALQGAYAGLQQAGLYGHDLVDWTEVLSDNARWVGTFDDYGDADQHLLRSDNFRAETIWDDAYDEINRVNQIIAQVPNLSDLETGEKNEILGEAYFLRALTFHDLVKLFGNTTTLGVALQLTPVASAAEANEATRATGAATYTQILADLAQAKQLITAGRSQTRQASLGAVSAIEARVRLYQQDWAGAEAAAAAVEAMGYSLAPTFSDLFDATGSNTPEDIFRVTFTPTQAQSASFYYLPKALGGRYEVAPTTAIDNTLRTTGIIAAFDPASAGNIANYHPTDLRGQYSISRAGTRTYAAKFRNPAGDEDLHVIRLAEVILIRAEALAMLNRVPEAIAEYNRLRVRAGLAPDPTTLTQAEALAAIARERRLELAFEGDRWPDMIRTNTGLTNIPAAQTLLPIPQSELDVSPNMEQNPGY